MKSVNRSRLPAAARLAFVVLTMALGTAIRASAQTPPPAQGTVALEGTVKAFYKAMNIVVVKTMDGMEYVYHFAANLVVHGAKSPGVDPLDGLREGATVVVHYASEGVEPTAVEIDRIDTEGLEATEGVVTRVDRRRKLITLKYDNGRLETFRLTDRAAAERGEGDSIDGDGKVIIYYSSENGHKVAHFLRRASSR